MSNGEHEIRTPKGLRIGNRSVVDGKNMLQIKRGGCEDVADFMSCHGAALMSCR